MPPAEPTAPSIVSDPRWTGGRVFLRLLRMLRPYWGRIGLGLLLLLLAAPCELFPAIVWKYLACDIAVKNRMSPVLHAWFSLGGWIDGRLGLLISAVS